MAALHTDDFRRVAVRIALTSGLTRRQVDSDLSICLSTLSKWIQLSRPRDRPPANDIDLAKGNDRLSKENRLLLEKREILKKGHRVLREAKQMRFAFIEEHRSQFPIHRLCQIMGVTSRGYRA